MLDLTILSRFANIFYPGFQIICFVFRFSFVFCYEGVNAVCYIIVGGRIFFLKANVSAVFPIHKFDFCCHWVCSWDFFKFEGPGKFSGSLKAIYVDHWIYLSQLGRHDSAKRTLSPYMIYPVSGKVVYSYQSGHYRLNFSLSKTSEGCLASNTQK